jgi:hypothetical protein
MSRGEYDMDMNTMQNFHIHIIFWPALAFIARPSRLVTRIYSIAICFSVLRPRQSSAPDPARSRANTTAPTHWQPDFVWLKLREVEDTQRGDVKNYNESVSMARVSHVHGIGILYLVLVDIATPLSRPPCRSCKRRRCI